MKKILVVAAPLALGACGGPIELTVAKLAGDLISYVSTGKSTTDHAVSFVAKEDCALHRPLMDQDVCKDNDVLLADGGSSLAKAGEANIKQQIGAARPEIYAVNAPAENWSRPTKGAVVPMVKTDLPPRATVTETALPAPQETAPVLVASASEQFESTDNARYGNQDGILDPQGEADAAIAGYVPDATEQNQRVSSETVTASLVEATVMTDDRDPVVGAIDAPVDGEGLAGDLVAPLPGDYVILASFSDEDRAQKALEVYRAYQPRLLNARVDGRKYMRVAVGPLSPEHASDLRLLAAKKGVKDPWIVGITATGE